MELSVSRQLVVVNPMSLSIVSNRFLAFLALLLFSFSSFTYAFIVIIFLTASSY